jgi:hypothetical protein
MKKIVLILVVVSMFTSCMSPELFGAGKIKVYENGTVKWLEKPQVEPWMEMTVSELYAEWEAGRL